MSKRHEYPGEEYTCLGCDTCWGTEQSRLNCEARHVEEELLAIGVYPEWRLGISPPQRDHQVDLDITDMGES